MNWIPYCRKLAEVVLHLVIGDDSASWSRAVRPRRVQETVEADVIENAGRDWQGTGYQSLQAGKGVRWRGAGGLRVENACTDDMQGYSSHFLLLLHSKVEHSCYRCGTESLWTVCVPLGLHLRRQNDRVIQAYPLKLYARQVHHWSQTSTECVCKIRSATASLIQLKLQQRGEG